MASPVAVMMIFVAQNQGVISGTLLSRYRLVGAALLEGPRGRSELAADLP
jgi:hypothetical protein